MIKKCLNKIKLKLFLAALKQFLSLFGFNEEYFSFNRKIQRHGMSKTNNVLGRRIFT